MAATIISHNSGNYRANALYYGILAFQYGNSGQFIPVQKKGNAQNMNAYAVMDSLQNIYLTIINKDTLNPVPVQIDAGTAAYNMAEMVSLSAPTVSDTFDITLAGSQVQPNGTWTPGSWQSVNFTGNYFTLTIPAATAEIIKLTIPFTAINSIPDKQALTIFPNPAKDVLNVQGGNAKDEINIYNCLGQILISSSLDNKGATQLDITNLSKGVYLLEGNSVNKGKYHSIFIKE